MSADELIKVRNLSYAYPAGPGHRRHKALDNLSFTVGRGEYVALAGRSGCGKSTLCRCLAGLIPHAGGGTMEGEVLVGGSNTRACRPCDLVRELALTFQNPDDQLFSNSVEADLAFGPENLGCSPEEIGERIAKAAESTGIGRLRERLIDELSGGEKQRVAIASALALLPGGLVLDEPTSSLDPAGAFGLIETLQKLCRTRSGTVLVVEHRLERLYGFIDRLIVLEQGKMVWDGRPEEAFERDLGAWGLAEPPEVTLRKRYGPGVGRWKAVPVTGKTTRGPCTLAVREVSVAYPGRGKKALDGVSLDLFRGELAFLMGANGSGKTTLARCLNGLVRPDSGKVLAEGKDLARLSPGEAARTTGLVFQNPDHLLFAESVSEELAFGPGNLGVGAREIDRRVQRAAGVLGLTPLLDESPFLLSGGEKQRVAIASVLTMDPAVLVLDEPTLGLDHGLKEALADVLASLKSEGKAIVVITHDVEFAAAHADRIVLLAEGRVLKDGSPREILTDVGLVRTAALHLPQAAETGLALGIGPVLVADEIVPEETP